MNELNSACLKSVFFFFKVEMTNVFKQYSVNQELLQEVERLREENKRLKKNF